MKSRMITKIGNPKKVVTPFNGDVSRLLSWREHFQLMKKWYRKRTRGYRYVVLGSLYGLEKSILVEIPKTGYDNNTHRKITKLEKKLFNGLGELYDPVTFEKLD